MSRQQSVHAPVAHHIIYVRRSYKERTAADLSDEQQEAACRALLPVGAPVRVISDSGGHHSGYSAARDGYQALLGAIRAGEAASVAVYDLSRLARNAKLMLELRDELERHNVPLLVANMPGGSFDGATGRYVYGQLCLAAQLQRDLDSERMRGIQRRLFEDGRHRGHDPFGYTSLRDEASALVRPRQLVVMPKEAAIVRQLWNELAVRSFDAVTDLLIREGVPHRRGWTRDAVKDIYRRGRFYLGYVVEKRGHDERPGHHEPILSQPEYDRTMAAIAARRRVGNKPKPFRRYVLRGLAYCSCNTRMRSEAHVQRGTDRRYYRCPIPKCGPRRNPADLIEQEVLAAIGEAVLPDQVIEAARSELRRRLDTPVTASVGQQRTRLTKRLEQLKKQHEWGDISDAEYLGARDEAKARLAELPDGDRITSFDAYRANVLSLPEAIAAASPERKGELCRMVVERVVVHDRQIQSIMWTPAARPFFEKRQRACPQGDSNP